MLNTVSLLKSDITKEIIKDKKLIKTKNNCKKEKDKILVSNWLEFLKFWIEKKIRIGGMVKNNSIKSYSDYISFTITDFKNEINVTYSGSIPNLFSEGKGVVAEGILRDNNYFIASKILAKHDENYMPPNDNNLNNNKWY